MRLELPPADLHCLRIELQSPSIESDSSQIELHSRQIKLHIHLRVPQAECSTRSGSAQTSEIPLKSLKMSSSFSLSVANHVAGTGLGADLLARFQSGKDLHRMPTAASRLNHVLSFTLALLVLAGVAVAALLMVQYHWGWESVWNYRQLFVQGWLTTLGIAAVALPLSVMIGLVFALARRATWLPLRYLARIYVELTRGTPLLVQIYLYFYVFVQVLGGGNRYVIGPLILAFFSGAYISEIIRGGIESVGRSQLESARAIGLTTAQTYRHVIFPQAIRQILPGLAGQFVSLVKDSSLLSMIAVNELFQMGSNVAGITTSSFEVYLPVAVAYLVITLPISWWTQRLEQRAKFET
jgi:polar amino acid transport system permease protein